MKAPSPYRKHIPSGLPVSPPPKYFFRVEPPLGGVELLTRVVFVVASMGSVLSILFTGAVVYVALHFIQKFW